jgi:hypothetical protein
VQQAHVDAQGSPEIGPVDMLRTTSHGTLLSKTPGPVAKRYLPRLAPVANGGFFFRDTTLRRYGQSSAGASP